MVAPSGGADETIVTRFVADTSQALSEIDKWRAQVDALKKQLQELAQASGKSFNDVAEGMRRAGPDLTGLTDEQRLAGLGDTKKWGKALSAALRESKQEAEGLDKELKEKPKDIGAVSSSFTSLGNIAKFVFGSILGITVIGALRDVVRWFGEAIKAGYEFSKSIYRAGVAIQSLQFRGLNASAEQTVRWVKELREEFGTLSEREALDVVATTQLLTRNLGFTEKQIKDVIDVSTALAIVQGKDVAESARQLVLFFSSGYGEGLQKAGIAVNRFTVAQEAMRMGFGKSYMALTEQERAAAAYSLVMKQVGEIVKAAGEYQETAAGQMDMLTKEIDTQVALLGTSLLPLKKAWLDLEVRGIKIFNDATVALAKYDLAQAQHLLARWEEIRRSVDENSEMAELADNAILGLKQRVQDAQETINTFSVGEKVAGELEKVTEASVNAAKRIREFRDDMDKDIILHIQVDPKDQASIDELEQQLVRLREERDIRLKGWQVSMSMDTTAIDQQIDETEKKLADVRRNIVATMPKADQILHLTKLDQQLSEISEKIAVIQGQSIISPAESKRLEILQEQAELLQTTILQLSDTFDVQLLETVTDTVEEITKLKDELTVLQDYQIALGADTGELDSDINSKIEEIRARKAELAVKLGIDPGDVDAFLAKVNAELQLDLSSQIEDLQKLIDELKELQKYRDTVLSINVDADTQALDAEIQAKVDEIEDLQAKLSVKLDLDATELEVFLSLLQLDVSGMARDLLDGWEDYTDKVREITQSLQDDIAQIHRDLANEIADIQRNMQQSLEDAARKYHESEWKAERDHQEKMRRLREGFLFDLEEALRERDAVQIMRLQRRYALDMQQSQRQYQLDKDERRRAYIEELADIRRQAAIEIEEARRQAAEELRLRQEQAEQEAQTALETYQQSLQERLDELALRLLDEYDLEKGQVEKILLLLGEYFGVGGKSSVTWDEYKTIVETAMQGGIAKLEEYLSLENEILNIAKEIAAEQKKNAPTDFFGTDTAMDIGLELNPSVEEVQKQIDSIEPPDESLDVQVQVVPPTDQITEDLEERRQAAKEKQDAINRDFEEFWDERQRLLDSALRKEYRAIDYWTDKMLDVLDRAFGKKGIAESILNYLLSMIQRMTSEAQDAVDTLESLAQQAQDFSAQIAAASAPPPATSTPPPPAYASGGYAYRGQATLGERGYEYVLNNPTTRAMEAALGGRLTQGGVLAATVRPEGGMISAKIEVLLAPGLEAEIVDKALDGVASTFDTVIRRR